MLIDLHCHTWPLSDDSFLSPDDLILAAKTAGLDGICLTEHDFFWDAREVQALAEKHSFLVIPGTEVNTEDGHMLVFGLHRYVYGLHRVQELAHLVEEAGGAVIAAHPYRRQLPFQVKDETAYQEALARASHNPAYRHVCAIEELNGRGSQLENHFSAELRARLALPGVGGSDAHDRAGVATCATYFQSPISGLHDLIRELRAGRFRAVDLRDGTK
ncbi:MAG: CehA/McbA family metallohydrolase [Dehalococcoidia bacterium]